MHWMYSWLCAGLKQCSAGCRSCEDEYSAVLCRALTGLSVPSRFKALVNDGRPMARFATQQGKLTGSYSVKNAMTVRCCRLLLRQGTRCYVYVCCISCRYG